jgi:diacylglycerol kinase (ATP)
MLRLWKAFLYSLAGLHAAWRDEQAFRLEIILGIPMCIAACFLAPDLISLLLMIASVLLVMMAELLNTALEATVNRIGTEIHPLAKKAKDTASAAVLMAAVITGVVWSGVIGKLLGWWY